MSIKKLLTTMTLASLVLASVPVHAEGETPAPAPATTAPAPAPEADAKPAPAPAGDNKEEGKPAEGQPADAKPADDKKDEGKPAESKPADDKKDEGKPADDKKDEGKPAESKPADDKKDEGKPAETPIKDKKFTTKYVADPARPKGEKKVIKEGKAPELNEDGTVKTPMVEEVISVGTKSEVEHNLPDNAKDFKPQVRYIADDKLEAGKKEQREVGMPEHEAKVTEYTLDEATGEVKASEPRVKMFKETATIVAVGTKSKVETKKGFAVKYIDDKELPEGKEVVVDKGVEGELEIRTTYTVNPETGEVTEKKEEKLKSGKVKVVRRGVKKDAPKVEKKEGDKKPAPAGQPNGGQPAQGQQAGVSTGKGLPATGDTSLAVFGALTTALGSAFALVRGSKKEN